MSNNTEQKKVQKKPTTKGSCEPPEMAGISAVKLLEYLKESPQVALGAIKEFVLDILSSLGIRKYVIIMFYPDNVDNPLHTSIIISGNIEKEWGDEKKKKFMNDFYETVMNRFTQSKADFMEKNITRELLAVNDAVYNIAACYGFDLVLHFPYDSASNSQIAYYNEWILVKK